MDLGEALQTRPGHTLAKTLERIDIQNKIINLLQSRAFRRMIRTPIRVT